jgi:hypothetical protein
MDQSWVMVPSEHVFSVLIPSALYHGASCRLALSSFRRRKVDMMNILHLTRRLVGVAAVCASLAACVNNPPRQSERDLPGQPSPTTSGATRSPGLSEERLTIQSGEGEKLNLPWFVRDSQEWINSH